MEFLGQVPAACNWALLGMPGSLSNYFNWMHTRNAKGLIWTPEPSALRDLRPVFQQHAMPLMVVLPNMSLYARDAMDLGSAGAVLKRIKNLSPGKQIRLLGNIVRWMPGLFRRRFAAGVMLLAEMEYLELAGCRVQEVLLHSSVVDMALAFNCREIFQYFNEWASRRGLLPNFMTYNFGLFAAKMKKWEQGPVGVVSPLNPKGYEMQMPSGEREALYKEWGPRWTALEIDAGGSVNLEQAQSFLENSGIQRAVLPWGAFKPQSVEDSFNGWSNRVKKMDELFRGMK